MGSARALEVRHPQHRSGRALGRAGPGHQPRYLGIPLPHPAPRGIGARNVRDGHRIDREAGGRCVIRRSVGWLLSGLVLLTQELAAQSSSSARPWTFLTRLVATGSSDRSEPAGYKVYSSFALDGGLRRDLSRTLAAELRLRTESREVDSLVTSGEDRRLGSLELLPMNLTLQLRPFPAGSVRPYAGGGLNLTVAWEKSGALDSVDMAGSV